jgi:hypothetical protein
VCGSVSALRCARGSTVGAARGGDNRDGLVLGFLNEWGAQTGAPARSSVGVERVGLEQI